jgi:hypothetical protein
LSKLAKRFQAQISNFAKKSRYLWVAWSALVVLVSVGQAGESGLTIEKTGEIVRLGIFGEDGEEYSLEAVEALLNNGRAWRSVATVAPTAGPVFVYDPTCTTKPQSFYRLRLLQGAIPVQVPNFRLLDIEGRARELFYESDQKGVVLVFCGTDLANVVSDAPALKAVYESFHERGVRFWLVVARPRLDRAQVRQQVAALGLDYTVLEDEGGAVTRQFASGNVPEAVVIDPSTWAIAYKGRIVDTVQTSLGQTTEPLLATAVGDLASGTRSIVKQTVVSGVSGGLPSFADRTYSQHIAPLLQTKCVRCHSPENIAPWAMTNHAIVQEKAPLIKDSVLTRKMPPWHADHHFQTFANSEMLSADELAMLVDWIDRGSPRGEGPDPLAESIPPPPPEWPLGPPDQIITIEPQEIPASGTVDYRYLIALNTNSHDVRLRAVVVKPGNRRVVHHVLVFVASTLADIFEVQGGLSGYFGSYVPGQEQVPFPDGTAKLLKKGYHFVFQLHYTVSGAPETDRTQLGLYLSPVVSTTELKTSTAFDTSFVIPPGAEDHSASAAQVLARDIVLYEMSPHMHYRGRRFRFDAIYPDGKTETLLNVPYYRFDWQSLYRLAEPKRLPAGTKIVCSGGWDNSSKNAFNPDPTQSVAFGQQSWEEMFIGYFNYSDPQ